MHHDELSARERAVLFTLLSAARKLSNTELKALIGVRLDGKERRKLNDLKLVESEKPGAHAIANDCWSANTMYEHTISLLPPDQTT